jgi:hypothetical protein
MAKRFFRPLVGLVLLLAIVYAADFLLLRYKVATSGKAFDTVTVRPYYAVPRKDKKEEYIFDDPQDDTCVNALFPHLGDSPCWYLKTHKQKRVDL